MASGSAVLLGGTPGFAKDSGMLVMTSVRWYIVHYSPDITTSHVKSLGTDILTTGAVARPISLVSCCSIVSIVLFCRAKNL